MAGDALPTFVDRKFRGDQRWKLFGHISPHAIMPGPRVFGRIDIEARAQSEGIPITIRHALSPRAGVRRDEDQPHLRARSAIFAFFGNVGVSAGESRQMPYDGKLASALRLRRKVDGESHV